MKFLSDVYLDCWVNVVLSEQKTVGEDEQGMGKAGRDQFAACRV